MCDPGCYGAAGGNSQVGWAGVPMGALGGGAEGLVILRVLVEPLHPSLRVCGGLFLRWKTTIQETAEE